jgi:hypothetical protein
VDTTEAERPSLDLLTSPNTPPFLPQASASIKTCFKTAFGWFSRN